MRPVFVRSRSWRKAAAAMALGGLCLMVPAPSGAQAPILHEASIRGGCALVDVDTIEFQRGRRGWQLYIAGLKNHANSEVALEHRRSRSGVWTIHVVGCTGGILGLPVRTPYWVALPLHDLPGVGRIEIVAANGAWRPRMPR